MIRQFRKLTGARSGYFEMIFFESSTRSSAPKKKKIPWIKKYKNLKEILKFVEKNEPMEYWSLKELSFPIDLWCCFEGLNQRKELNFLFSFWRNDIGFEKGGDFLEFTEKDSWRWYVVVLRNCRLLLDSAVSSFVQSQMKKNFKKQAPILPLLAVDMGLCDLGLDV